MCDDVCLILKATNEPLVPTSCNLVTNGGFETDDFTGFNATSRDFDTFRIDIDTRFGHAHSGMFFLFTGQSQLGPGGVISQVLGSCMAVSTRSAR